MSRPPNIPDAERSEKLRLKMRELRNSLRLTVPQFGALIGVVSDNITNREAGKCGWKPEEISEAKRSVHARFSETLRVLETIPD